ncbi:YVTN family beta-propeller protein [Kitasatospora sp. GAS204A]|uniref:YncE family protein n=1 Tax=unclassified Kitasatospora TaxID=2633591 RepID=UPI002476ECE1|nr:YncE family protein [Kitasatospora sp. GAS204B]MDH6120190.1 YVTN family beta-propeller protein [Kitasatospora sp. GAS204B]
MSSTHARRITSLAAAAVALAGVLALPGSAASADSGFRDVLVVGNSAAGTVSFIDAHTFQNLGSLNVTADAQQRIAAMDPIQWIGYQSVTSVEGGNRYVDDATLSPDGRTLYVSRGNLDDVAAYDIASGAQLWRTRLDGFKADHAALSPDGTRYVVSATTAQEAEVLDTASGSVVGTFPTGTYPHQNDYSPDGKYIYNSSIGITSFPQAMEWAKGSFQLTKVDATTLKVVQTWQLPHGIRPNVIEGDGRTMYTDLSYLNGFAKYDLSTGNVVDTVQMPYSAAGAALAPDSYPQNSAHHGLAVSGDGASLCDVGTIDDYTAIVATSDLGTRGTVDYPTGSLPYWGTTSADGTLCFVSLSKADEVSVIDYRTATEVARVPVGAFPQRERTGRIAADLLGDLSPSAG